MKTAPTLSPDWLKLLLLLIAAIGALCLRAQPPGTGTIQGRVFNPVSRDYVRNAEIRLEGTQQVVFTENDGSFQFTGVPAGEAKITVTFAGYNTVSEAFMVSAGQTALREISLTSTATAPAPTKDGVVRLSAFTVSSEREGNAKAIQAQRREMNIVTSVSSDIFGDVTDGNVGEFLKYLPGVDLDYVESEPRGPRLGGMEGQYVGVAFDGMRTASADANRGGGAASRGTSFEGFSITAIDSIEINWTASPENDADTPAGNVNMRTKRAFDRKGRSIGYNFSLNFNGAEFTTRPTKGPRDHDSRKVKPNYILDYAESFLDRRFGVLLSVSRAHSFTEQHTGTDLGINLARENPATLPATLQRPADTRPLVVRSVGFGDGPKTIFKDSILFTADWKVTPRLVLSLNSVYSYYEGEFWNRSFTWVAANDNNNALNGRGTVGGDGVTTIIAQRTESGTDASGLTNNQARLDIGGGGSAKLVYTRQLAPRFEYRRDRLIVDGALGFSKSQNNYEAMERDFGSQTEAGNIPGSFIATRPSPQSWEWTIRQTSGPDWFDLRNFTSTDARAGGTRIGNRTELWITEKWTGTLNAKWALPWLQQFTPTLKLGGKWDEESRDNNNRNDVSIWSYIGPGGNTVAYNPNTETYAITSWGSWGNLGPEFISGNDFEFARTNALTVYNGAGVRGVPQRPSRMAPAALMRSRPELFVNTATVENHYNAFIATKRDFRQTINAGYAQLDSRPLKKVQVRFGVRYEETRNELREFDPLTRAEMLRSPYASQFASPNTSRATSVSGLFYQYLTNPRVTRKSNYHMFFPSLSLKYNVLRNLEWQAGTNRSIGRPGIDSLTGLWVVDETNQRVTAPNPRLLPEKHKVYQTRLAYYFGGRAPGQLALSFRQTQFTNLITSRDYTPSEFGVDDPDFEFYTFRSTRNLDSSSRFRSMDLAYNQTLGFLPSEYLRGISVGLNYSRTYWSLRRSGVAPHRISSRLGYFYRRFNGSLGLIWADDKPEGNGTANYGRYFGALTKLDLALNFRLNRFATLFVQGRNITNTLDLHYVSPPGVHEGQQGILRRMEEYGANWNFGIKGNF